MEIELKGGKRGLKGEVTPPPDKSISHRAIMFSSLAKGRSVVRNFLRAEDTLSTMSVFRALGVDIADGVEVVINGAGLHGLRESTRVLDCGNSGTTMRLMSGVLSGAPFMSVLAGDASLSRRPMGRVIDPMRKMGATIMARDGDKYPPMAIRGGGLKHMRYEMPVASAQVKSCVLLAGLYADGTTEVIEKVRSRDHSERMLPAYGAKLSVDGLVVRVTGGAELYAMDVTVPNDFSSAAFFIVAGLIVPGSEIMILNVGMNPTRTGLLDVLRRMGAKIEVMNARDVSGEPVADLLCRHSALKAATVGEDEVPALVDEVPILAIAASMAEGVTRITGAHELRVKESDRIAAMATGLRALGVSVEEHDDGMSVEGRGALNGASVNSVGDHRIAMSFAVASLVAEGTTKIEGAEAVSISYPGFFDTLKGLTG